MSDAVKSPHRFIVGRTCELDLCSTAFARMLAGRRQMVLISGEPGIGKTCCAEAVAESAEDQGALVLWGRCHEEAGAPPYWPWVQIIRAYVDASSLDDVRLNLGATAHDIAALVPELIDAQPGPLPDSARQVLKRGAAPGELTLGVHVTGTGPRAAFISYASEDADAAVRVATSLRAAGIDVWLDQSELRGGETWDSAIKQQIKACALFIPIISAHSNARAEGYFRREWKLAVDRTHDMADDAPFLVPVVIDATSDANARTPDKFRDVQWTRLPGGDATASFVTRVRRLLASDSPPAEQAHRRVSDAGRERFRIFDAVRQFLRQATQKVPIVLVLDNLHWADSPSLSLLEFLSEELQRSRLLIVGTYRDVDARRKTPLLSMLGGLRPSADVQRVHLTGLPKAALREVAEQLCGLSLREPVLKTIYEQTDGNPFFAIELIRVLLEESGAGDITVPATIPAGVNEAISRRLIRFPDECNELLRVAAVHGRQFTAREIAAAAGCDMHSVLAGLDPATQAGIVQPISAVPGSYQFTHGLIRETIYQALTPVDRMRLHARAGDALVSVHSAHLDSALTRIAHHYYQAAALGITDKAVDFASRAADSAVRMGAYEDALVHYDHVIETLERDDLRHDQRLARAYILKGSVLRQQGQTVESAQVLVEAVNRTRLLGNVELLVDVLLSLVLSTRQVDQQRLVPLLHSALASLAEGDSPCRAKASATLAFARRTSTDLPQLLQVVDDALGVANRTGDVAARCACYQVAVMALRGRPETLQRRIRLGQEYVAVARAGGSTDLLADAYQWQALNYFESGQVEALEALLEHYEKLTAGKSALHQFQVRAHRVTLALLRGAWTDLEARMSELRELGTKTGRPDDADGVHGAQMFALNRDLGRLDSLVPELRKIAACADAHVWQPGLMLMLAETGMLAEARRMFEGIAERDFCPIERDDMYVTGLVFCAETCVALADAERAATLYQLLLPYAGQTANHPTAVCFGAADYYLASLAGTAHRPDIAGEHYERALTLNHAMRAWPALARTLFRYGAFLLSLSTDAERALGRQRLREAGELARRLGMARLAADIDALAGSRDLAGGLRAGDPASTSG